MRGFCWWIHPIKGAENPINERLTVPGQDMIRDVGCLEENDMKPCLTSWATGFPRMMWKSYVIFIMPVCWHFSSCGLVSPI